MVSICFLCCEDLESRTQKAKKLLLFDKAGRKYWTVLNDLAEERFGSSLDESHDSRECERLFIGNYYYYYYYSLCDLCIKGDIFV